jgi:cell pole-organizing protein PopZ
MGDISAEPSMEEILSSIKRIMAEEGDGPVRSRRPVRPVAAAMGSAPYDDGEDDDGSILELDVPLAPPLSIAPAVPPVAAPRPEVVTPAPRIDPVAEEPVAPTPPPPAQAAPEPEPEPAPKPADPDPIVSDQATAASRHAIEQLTRTLHAAAPAPAPLGPTADATLEGLVREMLRPMLRDWLDTRLPAIVEQHVATEIARITGGR